MRMKNRPFLATLVALVAVLSAAAQPSAVKNAAKSVFTITTFQADGTLLGSGHGVFVGQNGEAISNLKPFLGAASAVVIDQRGNKMNVNRIIGIDDIYDMVHFRVDGKTTPAPLANAPLKENEKTWLVGYALKNAPIEETQVKKVESFANRYSYYILDMNAPDNTVACPFVNASGQVAGLLKMSTTSYDTHAVDATYAASLSASGLNFNDSDMKKIGIPMAMPAEQSQAQLMLLMASQSGDSVKYAAAIDDFTSLFPTLIDGYEARARVQASHNQLTDAAKTMDDALKNVAGKDEAHYHFARLIYDNAIYNNATDDAGWTLDKAMEQAQTAHTIRPLPIYQHLQAQILYSQNRFQQAFDLFRELYGQKDFHTPELLYEQAQCKTMLQAPATEVIALLDSAINTTDTLRLAEAAPYFLARADAYMQTDSFRLATFDYTRYEILMQGRVNASFYELRHQAELKGRLYQQALTDIAHAIILAPDEPVYYAEMAQLQLRVNQPEQAQQTAQRCTEIAPDFAEGWLLLGLAQVRNGERETGLQHMRKAKDLGSEQAEALIEKYQ